MRGIKFQRWADDSPTAAKKKGRVKDVLRLSGNKGTNGSMEGKVPLSMEDEATRAGDLEEAVLADDLDEGVDLGGDAGHLSVRSRGGRQPFGQRGSGAISALSA